MLDSLKGYKTYIVVVVAVLSAILGYFNDQLTLLQALEAIGLALGLGGNRAVVRIAAIMNSRYSIAYPNSAATNRLFVTYGGVALTILTAILAGLSGQQPASVTIGTILGALGLNFLGAGAKKAATGDVTA